MKDSENRTLTDVVRDIISLAIDCVEHQYPIYPHTMENLIDEFNYLLKDSDLLDLEASLKDYTVEKSREILEDNLSQM
jgi:hypothetical protein